MNKIQKDLIIKYSQDKITQTDFINEFSVGADELVSLPLRLLEIAFEEENQVDVSHAMILAYKLGINSYYVDILCKLLEADWHKSHEDIAFALEQLKDPKSIDSLYKTALKQLDYLNYDDSFILASKCIWALGYLGISGVNKAIDMLKLLSVCNNIIIKDYALEQLERISNK